MRSSFSVNWTKVKEVYRVKAELSGGAIAHRGRSLISTIALFQMLFFSYSCAAVNKISTDIIVIRGVSRFAIAELFVNS